MCCVNKNELLLTSLLTYILSTTYEYCVVKNIKHVFITLRASLHFISVNITKLINYYDILYKTNNIDMVHNYV